MHNILSNINHAVLSGVVSAQVSAVDRAESVAKSPKLSRRLVGISAAAGAATLSGSAYAAAGCNSDAAESVTDLIKSTASFVISLGFAIALLTFAIAGILVMAGGTPQRVSMGMKLMSNTVKGMVILALGAFVRYVVVDFVTAAGPGSSGKTSDCIETSQSGGGLG